MLSAVCQATRARKPNGLRRFLYGSERAQRVRAAFSTSLQLPNEVAAHEVAHRVRLHFGTFGRVVLPQNVRQVGEVADVE